MARASVPITSAVCHGFPPAVLKKRYMLRVPSVGTFRQSHSLCFAAQPASGNRRSRKGRKFLSWGSPAAASLSKAPDLGAVTRTGDLHGARDVVGPERSAKGRSAALSAGSRSRENLFGSKIGRKSAISTLEHEFESSGAARWELASSNVITPATVAASTPVKDREAFVEVGYIANTHGLQGELFVHSVTDFPEERFEKPGIRWLRTESMGRVSFQEVELVKGRSGPGKRPSWLITLNHVNTVEEASQLVGATMLVEEDTKPPLDKDEFYIPDLVGMSVVLQETGEKIGVVTDLFSVGGGHDLLQVGLTSSTSDTFERKIWIPFVKEIAPVVDKELKRMEITPPQGLLELNAPAKDKGSKDGRKLVHKERRKLKGKLGGLKKRLAAMGQDHVLRGLSSGTEEERDSLLEQLLSIDFGFLQQAVKASQRPQTSERLREPPSDYPKVNWEHIDSYVNAHTSVTKPGDTAEAANMEKWWMKGLQLIADGKVAVMALAGGQGTRLGQPVKGMVELGVSPPKSLFQLQAERLLLAQRLVSLVINPELNARIPWIIMTSDATDVATRDYFKEKSYFGLDESQVWFMKQDSLPCISLQSDSGHFDVLMETPWRVAQAPNGNGGLFAALQSQGMIDRFVEEGIEYLQVYAVDNALVRVADPIFFGYTNDREADVGVKVVTKVSPEEAVGVLCLERDRSVADGKLQSPLDSAEEQPNAHYTVLEYSEMSNELRYAYDESVGPAEQHMDASCSNPTDSKSGKRALRFRAAHICVNIFSVDFLTRVGQSDSKFHMANKKIPHVKLENDEWIEVVPDKPNGTKLEKFIFDAFEFSNPDKVALLEVEREEEFAPVKNAAGPGVTDTVDTAHNLACDLQRRVLGSTCAGLEKSQQESCSAILSAYLGGCVGDDVLKLLRRDQ